MNLIEEIEAADHCMDPHGAEIEALCILDTSYWKRIKAALEAGREVVEAFDATPFDLNRRAEALENLRDAIDGKE